MDLLTIEQVRQVLKGRRFTVNNEKDVQRQIADVFTAAAVPHTREAQLSAASIIDFLVGSVGVEVKLKGTHKAIYAQCMRYCEFTEVEQLLVVTNKALHLPPSLNGKPTHILNIGLSWL